ncbi:thioesterase II family protein [Streptomyces longispororuber]|uniref:thioesterase II family protein n=1 Tax=Streptomyces longispororuber TaxID=68230 RepID=UPI00167D7534|nr:alpha/beta fold hydrolase [Streptomyces longispororuber]
MTTPSQARPVVAFIPPSCCGAGYFRRLRRELGDRVDVRALELPSHGRRYRETPLTDAAAAVADLAARVDTPLDALYGESLGAYLALGLADVLAQTRPPLLLAASNSPPSVRERIDPGAVDSVESAVAALRAMGGEIPPEVVSDPALAESAYPLIRADLLLAQSCIDLVRDSAAAGDLTVLAGADDTALTRMESWAEHTRGRCEVASLPGGHLLSATNPAGVAARVLEALARR